MKKLISLMLSVFLLVCCFGGCKAGGAANSTTDVEISYWNSGYGREWMDLLVEEFNKTQSTYKATLYPTATPGGKEIYLEKEDNTTDLYLTTMETRYEYVEHLEPLDDLLERKPDGVDGLTIKQKLNGFAENNTYEGDGKVYSLSWTTGGLTGLLYNKDLFMKEDGTPFTLPRTTDELIELCEQINLYGKNKTPFVHYIGNWYYVFEAWVAQLDGVDNYYKNWKGIYVDENGVEYPNDVRIVTESKGREETYKVLEKLLAPKGYMYDGTNIINHTTSQTYFLDGAAVMQPNGSWVENEMKSLDSEVKIGVMKTPVISAFADKISTAENPVDEDALRLLVDYVDGVTLESEDVTYVTENFTDAQIAAVKEARGVYYSGRTSDVLIPKYSICKDGAKAFLEFFYSDKGLEIMQNSLKTFTGLTYSHPENHVIDQSGWSDFMKEVGAIRDTESTQIITTNLNSKIFYRGGVLQLFDGSGTAGTHHPIKKLGYIENEKDMETAAEYWAEEVKLWEANWPDILKKAGIANN